MTCDLWAVRSGVAPIFLLVLFCILQIPCNEPLFSQLGLIVVKQIFKYYFFPKKTLHHFPPV